MAKVFIKQGEKLGFSLVRSWRHSIYGRFNIRDLVSPYGLTYALLSDTNDIIGITQDEELDQVLRNTYDSQLTITPDGRVWLNLGLRGNIVQASYLREITHYSEYCAADYHFHDQLHCLCKELDLDFELGLKVAGDLRILPYAPIEWFTIAECVEVMKQLQEEGIVFQPLPTAIVKRQRSKARRVPQPKILTTKDLQNDTDTQAGVNNPV